MLCDLTSLTTLATTPLLNPVLSGFNLHLAVSDRDAVVANLDAIKLREQIHHDHLDLWTQIREDERFVKIAYKSSRPKNSELMTAKDEIGLAAALLAQQRQMPLLADDRVCQNLLHYPQPSESKGFAFGSDKLIEAMQEAGLLDLEQLSDKYLKLIQWRYRFLVPPSMVLKCLALRYINNGPGIELRAVANYVHDCCRDAGLPLRQASDQPTSALGNRLFIEWVTATSDFISLLWKDASVSDEQAATFTEWALNELLPSPPRLFGPIGMFASNRVFHLTFTYILIQLAVMPDLSRAHKALKIVARGLGVEDDKFMLCVSEAIRGF